MALNIFCSELQHIAWKITQNENVLGGSWNILHFVLQILYHIYRLAIQKSIKKTSIDKQLSGFNFMVSPIYCQRLMKVKQCEKQGPGDLCYHKEVYWEFSK